jgi:hypothetical protein
MQTAHEACHRVVVAEAETYTTVHCCCTIADGSTPAADVAAGSSCCYRTNTDSTLDSTLVEYVSSWRVACAHHQHQAEEADTSR